MIVEYNNIKNNPDRKKFSAMVQRKLQQKTMDNIPDDDEKRTQ